MRFVVSLICLWAVCEPGWTGSAQRCDWSSKLEPKQGLARGRPAEALILSVWSNVTDPGRCRDLCCATDTCELALFGPTGSGAAQCRLVKCPLGGCQLEPSDRFLVYGRLKVAPFLNPPARELNTSHCRQPKQVGLCRAAFPRFYYDVASQTCRRFTYGGCGGNKNNFKSQEECEAQCRGVTGPEAPRPLVPGEHAAVTLPPSKKVVAPSALCSGAPDAGPCRAAFPMFYYDVASGSCHSFLYGGCRGNLNRHASLDECLNRCSDEGSVDGRGQLRNRWTAAFFLLLTLAGVSALLVAALIVITVRRRLPRRASLSDKEELLQDPDEPAQDSPTALTPARTA